MKPPPIILAAFALAFIAIHLWLGPVFSIYDHCACGQQRTWLEFVENTQLQNSKFLLRINSHGNPQHQHEYSDATYANETPIFAWIGAAFAMVSIGLFLYPKKTDVT